MSTNLSDQRPPDGFFAKIKDHEANSHDKRAEQVSDLQEQVQSLRDQLREERFLYVTLLVMFLDFVFFTVIDGLAALALVVMQLLILIPVARRMGMDEVAQILSRTIERLSGKSEDTD